MEGRGKAGPSALTHWSCGWGGLPREWENPLCLEGGVKLIELPREDQARELHTKGRSTWLPLLHLGGTKINKSSNR